MFDLVRIGTARPLADSPRGSFKVPESIPFEPSAKTRNARCRPLDLRDLPTSRKDNAGTCPALVMEEGEGRLLHDRANPILAPTLPRQLSSDSRAFPVFPPLFISQFVRISMVTHLHEPGFGYVDCLRILHPHYK